MKRAAPVVLVALSFAFALGLAEVALRVLFPIPYSMKIEYLPDPHVAFRLVPRREYELADGGTVRVNGWGLRGREVAERREEGSFRVLVLGGSSTFSGQTDDAAIWTRQLELALRERYGEGVEVVNAGVPGYSSFESKIHYVYRLRPLEPDAVLVYHTWNDMKLFRVIETKGYLQKGVFEPSPMRDFFRQFQLAWRLRSLVQARGDQAPREGDWIEVDPEKTVDIPDGGRAHRFERANLRDLAVILRADGVVPVFLSQAGLLAQENVEDRSVRERVYAEFQGLDYPEILHQWRVITGYLEAAAAEADGLFVDVYDAVPHVHENFRDHVHLTEAGHEVVARVVEEALAADPTFDAAVRSRLGGGGLE